MTIYCAWCGKLLKRLAELTPGISHGICQWCARCWYAKIRPVDNPWTLWQDVGGEG